MLGPLKFGLQKTPLAVAPAPGRFALTLGVQGATFSVITLKGPPGATANFIFIHPQTGGYVDFVYTIPIGGIYTFNLGGASTYTFTGSNLITEMYMRAGDNSNITGITGTYPTALKVLQVGFNYVDPVFTPPNVEALLFAGKNGPTSLTTGSNLTRLDFPPNLTSLNASASTKLTTLPALPTGVTSLSPPPSITSLNVSGCTGLTSLTVPSKVVTLDISKCTGITTVTLPAALTTLRMEGSGLTSLDLSKTNVTTLNIPPSMDAQLKSVNFGTKLKPSGIFRFQIPDDGVWTLY